MPLRVARRPGTAAWWILGSVRGRRIRESAGTERHELAIERAAAREAELYRAAVFGAPVAKVAFAAAALSYLTVGGPHSASTRARLHRVLRELGPAIACEAVDQVRLDQACTALLRPGSLPATRLREVITPVRAVLQHAARRGWCTLRTFDTGRASPARTEWLTPAEAEALIAAAAAHLKPLLAFLLGTGSRTGEALRLCWEDVDLAHAHALLRGTKNGSDRPLNLCPRVMAALASIAAPKAGPRVGRVFLTNRGKPYAARNLRDAGQLTTGWHTAVADGKISKPVTPHSCRHTWASWHYATHRDLLLLKRDGDWSTVGLVERYAHLVPATMAPAILAWRGTKLTQAGEIGEITAVSSSR